MVIGYLPLSLIPFRPIFWNSFQYQLNLWLERVLVEAEMSEEGVQSEVGDLYNLLIWKDIYTLRRPLQIVPVQDFLKNLQPSFSVQLFFYHGVEQEIEDGE